MLSWQCTWYLDPPYFIATDKGDYYQHNFTAEDHIRLKEKVNTALEIKQNDANREKKG